MANLIPIRSVRTARPGRADGSSSRGTYIVRWIDEDTGKHEARLLADSAEDARAEVSRLTGNNTVQAFGPV